MTVANALPASVQSLLTARVDRLAPADRALLQAAAVIGRRFDPDLLAVVAAPAAISTARSPPCKRSILSIAKDKTGDYIFKHALVRDAVYNSLLNAPLDQCCTSKSPRRSSGAAPIVFPRWPRHLRTTTRPPRACDKAFLYLAMAAKKCLDMYSLDEADRYARQALDLLETEPELRRRSGRRRRHGEPRSHPLREIRLPRNQARCTNATCRSLRQWAIRLSLSSPCTFTHWDWQVATNSVPAKPCQGKRWRWQNALGDLKAKTYAMNGILHASVFLARHSLENYGADGRGMPRFEQTPRR